MANHTVVYIFSVFGMYSLAFKSFVSYFWAFAVCLLIAMFLLIFIWREAFKLFLTTFLGKNSTNFLEEGSFRAFGLLAYSHVWVDLSVLFVYEGDVPFTFAFNMGKSLSRTWKRMHGRCTCFLRKQTASERKNIWSTRTVRNSEIGYLVIYM